MHILYLHQYFCPPGGNGNDRSRAFAAEWVKAGHRVTVITSPAYFPHEMKYASLRDAGRLTEFEVDGARVITVPVEYSHMMSFWQRMQSFMMFYAKAWKAGRKLENVDRIYASSTPLTVGQLGRKLARKHRAPFIFETVDVWPDVPIDMGIVKSRFMKWKLNRDAEKLYRDAKHIIALSEGMKEQIMSHGVPPSRISVIHNGTDPRQFPYIERKPGPVTRVVYSGTVGLANGLDALVKAAEILQKKGRKDIRFTILGAGNDLVRVKSLAAGMQLENLEFLDPVAKERVPEILGQAHIGVVCFANYPSLEANSANKFYDYLASGLPVVINYGGWQSRCLDQYRCGLWAPRGYIEAFAQQIEKLADDPAMRLAMGKAGRALAEEKFDRRNLAAEALKIVTAP